MRTDWLKHWISLDPVDDKSHTHTHTHTYTHTRARARGRPAVKTPDTCPVPPAGGGGGFAQGGWGGGPRARVGRGLEGCPRRRCGEGLSLRLPGVRHAPHVPPAPAQAGAAACGLARPRERGAAVKRRGRAGRGRAAVCASGGGVGLARRRQAWPAGGDSRRGGSGRQNWAAGAGPTSSTTGPSCRPTTSPTPRRCAGAWRARRAGCPLQSTRRAAAAADSEQNLIWKRCHI